MSNESEVSLMETTTEGDPNRQAYNDALSWAPQPMYYVVYDFQYSINDFVAAGVYTLESDAKEHERRLKNSYFKINGKERTQGLCIVRRTHEELCYEMADYRLSALAPIIRELLKMPVEKFNALAYASKRISALYSKSELPNALAKRDD